MKLYFELLKMRPENEIDKSEIHCQLTMDLGNSYLGPLFY